MTLDTRLRWEEIQKVCTEVVRHPQREYHFHTGADYSAERLGYAREDLVEPPDSITAFAGVGNPLPLGRPGLGGVVVDVGAGSGLDTFLAARAVGRPAQ